MRACLCQEPFKCAAGGAVHGAAKEEKQPWLLFCLHSRKANRFQPRADAAYRKIGIVLGLQA